MVRLIGPAAPDRGHAGDGAAHAHAGTSGASRSGETSPLEALVARGLGASLAQRGGSLTLRLLPETLGAMRIQMDVQQGVVRVAMDVENAEAHRLLTQSLDGLRSSLEGRGLVVDKLGVNLTPSHAAALASTSAAANGPGGNPSPGTGDGGGHRQDAANANTQHDAGDGRSRSWLGGDQRNNDRPGGAGPRTNEHTDAEGTSFGGLWQRLRLGVDTRV